MTEEGRERASEIIMYHNVMKHFLQDVLSLEQERAEHVACEMEHAVDRDIIERFACFLAFIENVAEQADSHGFMIFIRSLLKVRTVNNTSES